MPNEERCELPGFNLSDVDALTVMKKYKNVAVVGLSANPEKPSHYVPKYLKEHGWKIFPVNPTIQGEVLGEKTYPSLKEVPGKIEIVEIFRPPSDVPPIVKEAISRGAKVIWMQSGITNNEAAKMAREAGLIVVMDKCMMAIHQKSEVRGQRSDERKNLSCFLLLISYLLLLVLFPGCGKKQEEAPAPSQSQQGIQTVNPETAGTISGKVLFEGEVPPRKELPIKGNPECSSLAHGSILSENLLSKDGKLENVFVYVKEGLGNLKFDPPTQAVEIDNTNCVYVPHVMGAQVNQPITFKNNDPTLHNIHAFAKDQPGFNLGLPFQGMKQTKKFGKPEVMVMLKCDVHPWMQGYLGVLPHPYFAVSGEDGSFSIKNLPPGNYVLEAWHETLGTQTLPVTVGAKETKEVNVTFRR